MYIKIRVIPEAKKEVVEKISADTLRISVREPAERNLANNRVLEVVAREFKVTKNKVKIVSGHRSRSKIVSIDDGS